MANNPSFGTIVSPFNARRIVFTKSSGQSVIFARVTLTVFLPCRRLSRSKMAGRDFLLGTSSIYMTASIQNLSCKVKRNV